ncbi:protein CURLY FLAG LEAF 1-like [Phragmites australis]|uniref:protein CURLY FLAG LEAF 1-like n=1 Tax=Phragmites australis TaxID=29695 RepID=UPI002D796477|nr:protein CURLY FLAG LEAF 1-like [Phragmites australis]
MEVQPELSLGPTSTLVSAGFAIAKSLRSSSSDSDGNSGGGKKRKNFAWEEALSHASCLELQLGDPLPLDWEQCLDLHSGRMYYLNRKTMKKSWVRPKSMEEQGTVNLELNISTTPSTFDGKASPTTIADDTKSMSSSITSGSHMVAVPCVNCHLLVMLCKSSPACPNCKFVQPSVPAMPQTPPRRLDTIKPLETLSLLH